MYQGKARAITGGEAGPSPRAFHLPLSPKADPRANRLLCAGQEDSGEEVLHLPQGLWTAEGGSNFIEPRGHEKRVY